MDGRYISMEHDDEDTLDRAISIGPDKEMPSYPYGLRLAFTEAEMSKLGMTGEPQEGDILHFSAFGKVTHFSRTNDASGTNRRLELQVVAVLAMEDENDEVPGRGK